MQCEVAPPPPPRRRKRKLDERELVRRLAKYEELMEKNGVDFRSTDESFEPLKDHRDAAASHQAFGRYVIRPPKQQSMIYSTTCLHPVNINDL